jgi:membrane-anchored protein YejM (alkaline phosphatase superfamily)
LSEPAVWTGTAVPHQQYPNEYWRMNSLQKLLEAGHYQAFVSKDHILQHLLAPWPELTELDRGLNARDYDLCRTLAELGDRITTRNRADGRPLFAYTQPQNVHIAAITREGATVPAGESYPGFYAPYASRVHRLDACFGQFLDTLRREQLYDDSLIILTSDHGESIGEDGRWGHAYTLFPEVLKIPMIVHLPVWMRGVSADPNLVAFTVDLTPTLYYLLGQRPIAINPLFGRPLFTERPDEVTPYLRSHYVVASSYGPVYAVISDAGRSLYIADGVSNREYAFDLTTAPGGTSRVVTDAVRDAGVKAIRDMIRDLTRFSRVPIDPQ